MNPALPPCDRCGACCMKGGPALHIEDIPLVARDVLAFDHLVTLRRGEPAFDQIQDRVLPLAAEIVKVAPRPGATGWACRFHERDAGCGIYAHRPLECRLLSCKDTGPIAAMYDRERIARCDLVAPESAMAELMVEHERLCPVAELAALAEALHAGDADAAAGAEALLAREESFRRAVAARAGLTDAHLAFFFGRPLAALLPALGLARLQGRLVPARRPGPP